MIKFNDQLPMIKFNFQGKNSWNSLHLTDLKVSAESTPCNSPAFQLWPRVSTLGFKNVVW